MFQIVLGQQKAFIFLLQLFQYLLAMQTTHYKVSGNHDYCHQWESCNNQKWGIVLNPLFRTVFQINILGQSAFRNMVGTQNPVIHHKLSRTVFFIGNLFYFLLSAKDVQHQQTGILGHLLNSHNSSSKEALYIFHHGIAIDRDIRPGQYHFYRLVAGIIVTILIQACGKV